jgi:site-specific recombinase XerD
MPVTRIQLNAVAKFLAGTGPITRTWHVKYFTLKSFFQFAVSRGHLDKVPLPTELPECPPTLVPYIYSREELRRLLDAIPSSCRPCARVEPHTLRAILLLMYGAGLRRGEVLELTAGDVDLPNSLLTVRNTKFFKSRLVPINADLTKVLRDYLLWRAPTHTSAGTTSTFSSADKAKRFATAHWRVPSSDCRSVLGFGAPTIHATNLGCTTFGIPLRSIA